MPANGTATFGFRLDWPAAAGDGKGHPNRGNCRLRAERHHGPMLVRVTGALVRQTPGCWLIWGQAVGKCAGTTGRHDLLARSRYWFAPKIRRKRAG
jgi:hypothetical protein